MPATRSSRPATPPRMPLRTWATAGALLRAPDPGPAGAGRSRRRGLPRLPRRQGLQVGRGQEPVRGRRQAAEERPRRALLHGLPRGPEGLPARAGRRQGGVRDLPPGRARGARQERPRAEERRLRGALLHGLPRRDPRVPASQRPALARREAEPAAHVRRLPREPELPGAPPDPPRAADRGLRAERPRPGGREGQRQGRVLLRLPRHPRRPAGRGRRVADQPLERAGDLRPVPRARSRRPSRPASTGRPWRAASPARRSAPTATASTRSSRLREPGSLVNPARVSSVTCGRCHADERLAVNVQPAAGQGAGLRGQLPRPGRTRRLADGRELRLLPRRPQHPAVERPALDGHPANLAKTCGDCHPGAGERFAIGPVHVTSATRSEHPAVRFVRVAYLTLIPADARASCCCTTASTSCASSGVAGATPARREDAAAHEPALPDRARARRAELPGAGGHRLRAQVPRCLVGRAARRLRGRRAHAARLHPPRGRAAAVRRLRLPRGPPRALDAGPASAAAHAAEPQGRARRPRASSAGRSAGAPRGPASACSATPRRSSTGPSSGARW